MSRDPLWNVKIWHSRETGSYIWCEFICIFQQLFQSYIFIWVWRLHVTANIQRELSINAYKKSDDSNWSVASLGRKTTRLRVGKDYGSGLNHYFTGQRTVLLMVNKNIDCWQETVSANEGVTDLYASRKRLKTVWNSVPLPLSDFGTKNPQFTPTSCSNCPAVWRWGSKIWKSGVEVLRLVDVI